MASELQFDEVTRKRWAYSGHIGIAASVLQNVSVAGVVVNDTFVSRIVLRFWAGTAANLGPCCNNPISAEPMVESKKEYLAIAKAYQLGW